VTNVTKQAIGFKVPNTLNKTDKSCTSGFIFRETDIGSNLTGREDRGRNNFAS